MKEIEYTGLKLIPKGKSITEALYVTKLATHISIAETFIVGAHLRCVQISDPNSEIFIRLDQLDEYVQEIIIPKDGSTVVKGLYIS